VGEAHSTNVENLVQVMPSTLDRLVGELPHPSFKFTIMTLIIANDKIKSPTKSNIYAQEGDLLKLIAVHGHVGIYYNYYKKERFPASTNKTKTIDSRIYIKPISKADVKIKSVKPTNQLSLF
jgi:hypothetical protein